jgi:hypothetical protein
MPQPAQQLKQKTQIKQKIKVSEKVDVGQKIIGGIAVLCAFTALLNFSILFNTGLQGLSQQMVENQSKQSITSLNNLLLKITRVEAQNRENNVSLALTHNDELNNLAVYTSGQQDVNLLAFDLTNNSTSTLILSDMRLLAYVNGGYSTSSPTSTYLFSPGWNYLDGGVYAASIIENIKLYNFFEGHYTEIASATTITEQGYINFYDLSFSLSPQNITTLVIKGNITNSAPYGDYSDLISLDIQDWRRDVYIYNMVNNRIRTGPNNINHSSQPRIYHMITN